MIETLAPITVQVTKEQGVSLLNDWRFYFGLMLYGLFTGLGSSLGNYIFNKHLLEGIGKVMGRIKK